MFAGKNNLTSALIDRETFLYLETKIPLSNQNRYRNLRVLCYLLELATGLPSEPKEINIDKLSNFEAVFSKFKANLFYEPEFNYGGLVNDKNTIARIPAYSKYLKHLSKSDLQNFENSLQTYIWAEEIQKLPNPQLHYTLYMTLFLSSINQLAENPSPICASSVFCPDCDANLNFKHSTSHVFEMEKLIRSLITGKDVDGIVRKVKKLYHNLRSNFLHDGLLSGEEREGGFFSDLDKSIPLVEDMANLTVLNRKLLELFLQQRASNA